MNLVIDDQIVRLLTENNAGILKDSSFSNLDHQISFRWSSLLECLELGSLFLKLPMFESNEALFEASIAALHSNDEKDVIHYLYDQLFTESLNQIKNLPEINASFLTQTIRDCRKRFSHSEAGELLNPALTTYETAFFEKSSQTLHDLILYLSWDRMCVWMAHLFSHPSTDEKFIRNLKVLRECLIESYLHIMQDRKTSPTFFRMLEALFFYQMREENLEDPTPEEWALLCQSFPVLKPELELMDFHYIDDAIASEKQVQSKDEGVVYYLTRNPLDIVDQRIALTQYMLSQLKAEIPKWKYILQVKEISYL